MTGHYAPSSTENRARYEKLNNEEQKIHQMIIFRFLGLFAQLHKVSQAKVTIEFGKERFILRQNRVVQARWKGETETKAETVKWEKGMKINPDFAIKKELSAPPKPLSEASLLDQMEEYNLGTPATRAGIVEELIKSELMEHTPQGLRVSSKGKQLLVLVNPSLVTPDLTKNWEKDLETIAAGKRQAGTFSDGVEKETERLVNEIKSSKQEYQDSSVTQEKCPECGVSLREKNTRDGKIYVCTNSGCNYRRRKDPRVSNHRCPQCHREMEIIGGKNDAYFRCKYDGATEKMLDKKE